MKHIRFFSVFCVLLMVICCFAVLTSAQENNIKLAENVNVAQYKDVVLIGDTESPYFPIGNIVDGARSTFAYPSSGTDGAYITIDLAKRYKLEKLELYSRQDGMIDIDSRTNLKILLSNDADFENSVTVAEFTSEEDSFSQNGYFSLELDGKNAYRYIRLEKTAQGYWAFGELKAFADVEVTKITDSTNQITLNGWYLQDDASLSGAFAPTNILDGSNDTFLYQMNGEYNYFTVDLGKEYYVDMIEMDKRNDGSASWYYVHDITMYGSNIVMTETGEGVKNEALPNLDGYGYDKLSYIQMLPENDPDRQFPLADISKGYSEMVKDTNVPYRYITYKKNNNQTFTELSELRAYYVNPEIYGKKLSGQFISVDFTDVLDEDSIDADSVQVFVDGIKKDVSYSLSDSGYSLGIDLGQVYYSCQISVVIDGVKTIRNATLTEKETLIFDAPPAIDVNDEDFVIADSQSGAILEKLSDVESGKVVTKITFKNNTPDSEETVVLLSVLLNKEDNTVVRASEKRVVLPCNTQTDIMTDEMIITEQEAQNCKLRVLVWQDYNLMTPWVASKTIN